MRGNIYLEETLESCKAAFPRFEHVFINEEKLRAVAEENALKGFLLPRWDYAGVQPQDNNVFISYCFWWNVINFCFDYSSRMGDGQLVKFAATDVNGREQRGAYAMEACLYKTFGEKTILAEDILGSFRDYSNFAECFRGRTELPLLRERWEYLLMSAEILSELFDGDPRNILEKGKFSAFGDDNENGIIPLILFHFPTFEDSFRDSGRGKFFGFPGLSFWFYKRAQLFVLMYHGRASQSDGKLTPISDINCLGPIPDYELPKSYAADGIFTYGEELQDCVIRALPILRHGKMEIEIRAATVWCQIKELKIMNAIRFREGCPLLHIGHVDYYRWKRGRESSANHHLCYTTDY